MALGKKPREQGQEKGPELRPGGRGGDRAASCKAFGCQQQKPNLPASSSDRGREELPDVPSEAGSRAAPSLPEGSD